MRAEQFSQIGRRWRRAALGAVAALVVAGCPQPHDKTNWVYDPGVHWPPRTIVPANVNGFAITTNNLDDTMSWVDLSTLAPLAKLPVGLNAVELEGPHHLQTSNDGQFLYVGMTETFPSNNAGPHGAHGSGAVPGYVLKIRISDGAVVGSVRVDRNPGDLILNAAGTKLYVSHFDVKRILDVTAAGGTEAQKWSGIAVIDTGSMTRDALVMVCPAEHGMALSPDETKLYVSCYGSDQIAVVDLTQPSLPSTLIAAGTGPGELPSTTFYAPYAATLTSDGQTVWFSCWNSGDIRAFDIATGQFQLGRTITVGGYPAFGDRWGDRVVIARQSGDPGIPDDRIVVIGSDGSLVTQYSYSPLICTNAHAVRMIPGQPGKAMLVCEGNHVTPGTLVRVDLATGAVDGTAAVGIFPDAVSYVGGP